MLHYKYLNLRPKIRYMDMFRMKIEKNVMTFEIIGLKFGKLLCFVQK